MHVAADNFYLPHMWSSFPKRLWTHMRWGITAYENIGPLKKREFRSSPFDSRINASERVNCTSRRIFKLSLLQCNAAAAAVIMLWYRACALRGPLSLSLARFHYPSRVLIYYIAEEPTMYTVIIAHACTHALYDGDDDDGLAAVKYWTKYIPQTTHHDAHKLRQTNNFTVRNRCIHKELCRTLQQQYVYGIFEI